MSLYDQIATEGLRLPSEMGIFGRNNQTTLSFEYLHNQLKNTKDFEVVSFEEETVESDNPALKKQFTLNIVYKQLPYDINLFVVESNVLDLDNYARINYIDENDVQLAKNESFYLESSMYFSTNILESFHLQLKVLTALVPNPTVLVDFMPARLLSGQWAKVASKLITPPSPHYIYTIHGVYDEIDGEKTYWLHTHGLHRCGTVELEMIAIKNGVNELNGLLDAMVSKFIYEPAPENEPFNMGFIGYDLNFVWMRWEDVVTNYPAAIPGGLQERTPEEGNYGPSGVVYLHENNEIYPPDVLTEDLRENPIYFIKNEETERMSALAYEQYHYFKKAFQQQFGQENWRFLMKLGLPIDEGDGNEHLWFDVTAIDEDDTLQVTLLNQPYQIEKYNQNDVLTLPLKHLTDWVIYAPEKSFTPDSIYELFT
ncbi:DUF4026 domain-containing protein [Flavobacterium sp. CBA20B-1]|uniref:DUF4026 domain-containing protein n=1 Tax=unclassified Flavobacterium TaxID=196869 RepID=UPI0022254636|nr:MULTISPECIES: DUF4026 domain-containing protein [unclassified Flavobacterium]WCM43412.1 DUF4026 domain-containing protein [Flavobacterium sp. CBA20B-1]